MLYEGKKESSVRNMGRGRTISVVRKRVGLIRGLRAEVVRRLPGVKT
jgi:hypothetical protein